MTVRMRGVGAFITRPVHDQCVILRSPGLRAHVLRGTAATALLRAGRSVRDVQALLGHAQLATTAKYLLVTDDDLTATVAASPFG